jgi:hypothetical protein
MHTIERRKNMQKIKEIFNKKGDEMTYGEAITASLIVEVAVTGIALVSYIGFWAVACGIEAVKSHESRRQIEEFNAKTRMMQEERKAKEAQRSDYEEIEEDY